MSGTLMQKISMNLQCMGLFMSMQHGAKCTCPRELEHMFDFQQRIRSISTMVQRRQFLWRMNRN